MKFNLDKEREEIAYLNGLTKVHLEEGKKLNERAKEIVARSKELFN